MSKFIALSNFHAIFSDYDFNDFVSRLDFSGQ